MMKKLCFLMGILVLVDSGKAEAKELDIACFGDSATAGFLADYYREPAKVMDNFVGSLQKALGRFFYNPWDLGAPAALFAPLENRHRSWACGNQKFGQIQSVVEYLKSQGQSIGRVQNFAWTGATSRQMPDQMSLWKKDKDMTRVALMLVGANDVCRDRLSQVTPPSQFRKQMYANLVQAKKKADHVFYAFPYDLSQLITPQYSCRSWFLKVVPICSALTVKKNPVVHKKMLAIYEEYRSIMREITQELGVHYSESLYSLPILTEELSIDCIHPNPKGQKKLAETLRDEILEMF